MEISYPKFDCAIFSAGTSVSEEIIFKYISSGIYVIAADAGYKLCKQCNIIPNLFLGDYDSAQVPKTDQEIIKLNPVKDETDTAYALEIALQRGFKNIVLFGALGGRLDHEFANLQLCGYARNRGVHLTIIDNHHKIFAAQNESLFLYEENKYISIFPFGDTCTLTLKDFDYPLEHTTLPALSGLGVSNEMHCESAQIIVEKGTALVMIVDKD